MMGVKLAPQPWLDIQHRAAARTSGRGSLATDALGLHLAVGVPLRAGLRAGVSASRSVQLCVLGY